MSHSDIKPVEGPRVWYGAEMSKRDDWIYPITDDALVAVDEVVRAARSRGEDSDSVDFASVDLEPVREFMDDVADELAEGRGFVLVRGIPVERYDLDALKMLYLVLGAQMGIVSDQAYRAPRIGEVYDRMDSNKTFYFHRGGGLPFHMDPVDVVGLLCVRPAKKGGESGIASSMAVHNEILATRPDLLEILYHGYHQLKRHNPEDQGKRLLTEHPCPIFADIGGEVVCDLLPESIAAAQREGLVTLSAEEQEALDYVVELAARPDIMMTMDFRPGDIQFLNNRTILHNRLDYEDYPEVERRRLLLRLWLTMPGWRKYPANIPHTDMELMTTPA